MRKLVATQIKDLDRCVARFWGLRGRTHSLW
jgi:hypothetical protein